MAEKKSPPKSATLAKEKTFEDAINEFGFSRNVTTKSSALFFGNAVIVSFVPICKYHSESTGCAQHSNRTPIQLQWPDFGVM
jgi:Translocon-associated protein, gamma subunit (TRAP-gamma)